MKTKQQKPKFDYGRFRIEYRFDRDGVLLFLQKKIDNVDDALREANDLNDKGYHDVLIRTIH